MLEAVRQGLIEIKEHEKGERYFLESSKEEVPCDELGIYLGILGGVGYYQNGPDMGVRVCLEGVSPESDRMVEELKTIKTKAFDAEIGKLKGVALKKSSHIQWFHVGNRFSPMGVKMIGDFCHALRNMDFVDPKRYIAGFQILPNEIPGFGPFAFNEAKISMRVSPYLEREIKEVRAMGLDILLPEATNRLGGFSDACHSLTAATMVAIGKEEKLIEEMEKILGG
jgi:hypothetical protein